MQLTFDDVCMMCKYVSHCATWCYLVLLSSLAVITRPSWLRPLSACGCWGAVYY